MAETPSPSKINSEVSPNQAETFIGLPKEIQAWLAQSPSEIVARWRMELAAGLRDADGKLTCANLHNPDAPISEACRISDALMDPSLRKWLSTPIYELLREWKSSR